jgi:hypothetical protein
MNLRKSLQLLSLALLILWTSFVPALKAQQPESLQLPQDLVFTGKDELTGDGPLTLALLDATTLEVRQLYIDETAVDIKPLAWSPQGDQLSVVRILEPGSVPSSSTSLDYLNPTQLCIITLAGDLSTCFSAIPPDYAYTAPFLIDYNYFVTWSEDGERLYFVSEELPVRRLIEASVDTGETLRTIYEFPATDEIGIPSTAIWTDDLTYLSIGVGLHDRKGVLVELGTGEEYDLAQIIAPLSTENWDSASYGYICPSFSPQGTLLSAIDEHENHILIFDTKLEIIATIGNQSTDRTQRIECPTWSEDGQQIYFFVDNRLADTNSLYSYSLTDQETISRVRAPFYSPFVFSPESTHVAFERHHPSAYEIGVLYPTGDIHYYGQPFDFAMYPVWRTVSE